jgi:hypothetical protein
MVYDNSRLERVLAVNSKPDAATSGYDIPPSCCSHTRR